MVFLFIVITILMDILVFAIVKLFIPRVIIVLANHDLWWSPVRTLPPPGEMYIMVRGDPDGPFDSLIESVKDFIYDKNTGTFEKDVLPTPKRSYFHRLGVTWVGFQKYILWRKVSYDKWEMTKDAQGNSTGQYGLVPKIRGVRGEGASPSIFFRYNMATEIKAAETRGNFPVNALIVFTVQIRKPSQAFFLAGGWESQTVAAVQSIFREHVGYQYIDELREELRTGADSLVWRIKNLTLGTKDHNDGLFELFGIEIIDARFVSFDLVTGDPVMAAAVRAVEVERLKANAAAERGQGESRERETRAVGVRAEVLAWGSHPVGGTIAMAEAIKVAQPNVLGAGVIASVPSERRESTD